ncbi:MAG: urate hydroxylase PuuD [Planctomycetes bacterium]|nr:urate hydroxylase PuuD [Planctomycetota bacterium]
MTSLALLMSDFEKEALIGGMLRWFHILAGITWIGLLYFFNLVNVPTQGKLDGPTKKAVNPELLPRALWWFRWGAAYTVLFGLILFYWKYMRGANMRDAEGGLSERAMWIMLGMTLGLIMAFNVWAIIWPAQRTIIRATKEGQKPPEGLPEKAKLFSRINFILSGPMLVGMIAANNAIPFSGLSIAVTMIVSLLIIHVMLRLSAKVGASI